MSLKTNQKQLSIALFTALSPFLLTGCGTSSDEAPKHPSTDYVVFRNSLIRKGWLGPFKIGKVRPGEVRWELEFDGIDPAPKSRKPKKNKDGKNASQKQKESGRKTTPSRTVRFRLQPPLREGFRISFYAADDAIESFEKMKLGERVTIEGKFSFVMFERYYGMEVLPSEFELIRKIPIDEEKNQITWRPNRIKVGLRIGLKLVVSNVRPARDPAGSKTGKTGK